MKSAFKSRQRKSERGYALLAVAFATTLLMIAALTAAPGIIANRKREAEKEMIWRGNQYVRGIKMYYRKTGKFPTSLDDLIKPQLGNIRFMRQAYKDPMNKEDGSWRLIYVGPSGQLIGSLRPPQTLALPTGIPGATGVGTPAANLPGAGINGAGGTQGPLGPGNPGAQPQQGNGTQAAGTGTDAGVSTDTDANGNPPPSGPPITIMGGNIIGVGSTVNKSSVIYYNKAKNYRLFEFIWDPSKDVTIIGGPQQAIPGTTQPGVQPGGMQPGTQQSPFGNPGMGNPSPNPPLSNPPQN